ncbi:MAG: carboxypeptidase-like regulatory domain-containing protein [Rhodothermales bacterium]
MKTTRTLAALVAGWLAAGAPAAYAQTHRDAASPPLDAALLELAEARHLQLAYAPELLENKQSGCPALPDDNTAAIACILSGTGLEVDASAGDVFVIFRPSAMKPYAQAGIGSGSIAGAVHATEDGQPLPGAHIRIAGIATGAASGPDGRYTVTHVPAGHYDIVVTMVGFQPRRIDDVQVRPGQTVTLDATLDAATLPLGEVVVSSRQEKTPGRLELGPVSIGAQDVQVGPVSAGLLVSARPEPVRGVQLSGIASMVRDTLDGVQISGIFNTAENASHGVQMGGILNLIDGSLDGVQLAGVVNGLNDDLIGVQLAGVANQANGSVRGVQGSGTLNLATGSATGVQLAGTINIAGDRVRGVQGAGLLNKSGALSGLQASGAGNFALAAYGVQVAGVANVAAGELVGAQISLLNVAGPARGAQIGLVNVAESLDGFPLGLVSFVKDVGLRYDVLVDETGTVSTVLRSGNRRFANYIGIAARPNAFGASASTLAGLGVDFSLGPRFYNTIDALYQSTGWNEEPSEHRIQLRALLGFRVAPHLDLVAGPALNLLLYEDASTGLPIPWKIESGSWRGTSYTIWPGFSLGLRLSARR